MHYLVTGHTGFKGAWLTLVLTELGHTVSGIGLDPLDGSLFERARISRFLDHDIRIDIRDSGAVTDAVSKVQPDVLMHLAAQALVRESYQHPRLTFETNVMGTLNVLEALPAAPDLRAALVVTTDKVYRNVSQREGYEEEDPLGGDDPYSSSKAMADILTQSWIRSFPGPPAAVARGGNVIGGGDVSKDRLLVDLVDAFRRGESASIRFPDAVRPWQHVLDCLFGYLAIVDDLLTSPQRTTWNIGPLEDSFVPVGTMADRAAQLWGREASWHKDASTHPHEATLLMLDSSRARSLLTWNDRLPYPLSLDWTVDWWLKETDGGNPLEITLEQIAQYTAKGG
ncbi:CDP-glucose 4,6-dehydratase [Microcella sp.]|uniref:CDP-glucose 4,6-dehydratase n=1 Tax=Microcella sp. TaxID=1913979 RepID=UPI003F6E548E